MTQAELIEQLQQRFEGLFSLDDPSGGALVPVERHLELARFVKEQCGFTLYVTVAAAHYPSDGDGEGHYEIGTVLRRPSNPSITFAWRVRIAMSASIPTLYTLFVGADWQEREQYDLVGVQFSGHPDPRRLMMPEDWPGHPLLKDYAIDTPHAPWR
ncbi:MAG: NADH-quinone oxidoreductase subunit C [Kiritimatiellia bacterium]|jgi:NADH-quinone oxidoreductase subunit C